MTSCRKRSSGPGGTCRSSAPVTGPRGRGCSGSPGTRSSTPTGGPRASRSWCGPRPPSRGHDDTGLTQVLDQQLLTDALHRLSPAHRTVLVETFYQGHTLARTARQLGIPDSTARSRLHYALQALRRQLEDYEATEPR